MKKKIAVGIISAILIYLSSLLILSGAHKVDNEFRYYENINFDFIIPKPWYSQISEIENLDFINSVTPYYMTNKSINGSSIKLDFFIIEEDSDIEHTPYSRKMLISGDLPSNGELLIDLKAQQSIKANIGDEISTYFGDQLCSFKISGIVQTNQFASRPTALIYYESGVKNGIEESIKNLSYSGAFVDANNIAKAEDYFNKTYRAKGKIGERSWYKDDDSYEFMKNSIESKDVAKEIINTALLKANSLSSYTETSKSNIGLLLVTTFCNFIIFLLIWLVYLVGTSKSYRKRINNGEKVGKIIKEFRTGALITLLLTSLLYIVTVFLIGITSSVVLIIFNLIAFIIILSQTNRIVNKK